MDSSVTATATATTREPYVADGGVPAVSSGRRAIYKGNTSLEYIEGSQVDLEVRDVG